MKNLIMLFFILSCNFKGDGLAHLNLYDGLLHKTKYLWITNNNEPIQYEIRIVKENDKIDYYQTHSNGALFHYTLYKDKQRKSYHLGYSDTTWLVLIDTFNIIKSRHSFRILKFKELASKECLELEDDSIACENDLYFINDIGLMLDKNRMCIAIDSSEFPELKELHSVITKWKK